MENIMIAKTVFPKYNTSIIKTNLDDIQGTK